MKKNLDSEADGFGFMDSFLSTFRFDSDEETIDNYHDRAKRNIGN